MAEFKVGDRVCCYNYFGKVVGIITLPNFPDILSCERIPVQIISFKPFNNLNNYTDETGKILWFHKKQCRKLIKKKKMAEVKKFDPGKPVQTRNGRKARIVCTDSKWAHPFHEKPILALIDHTLGESLRDYYIDGRHDRDDETDWDLINIPEPKPLELHVGGVYKAKNGCIGVCLAKRNENFTYPFNVVFFDDNIFIETVTINGKVSIHEPSKYEFIEKIADIRDLHPEIKAYFEKNNE